MYWQISGMGGRAPPRRKPTRSAGSRWPAPGPRTSFSSSLIRRASSVVVPGRSPRSISACLTHVRRASGWIPSSSAIRRTAPLDRSGSALATRRHPSRPLAQLQRVLPLSHGSDPSCHHRLHQTRCDPPPGGGADVRAPVVQARPRGFALQKVIRRAVMRGRRRDLGGALLLGPLVFRWTTCVRLDHLSSVGPPGRLFRGDFEDVEREGRGDGPVVGTVPRPTPLRPCWSSCMVGRRLACRDAAGSRARHSTREHVT